ncbi:MAG TPA: hypothetical protein VKR53_16760, partial [Puia sp.]|nr:hypothetical protein [Puia sp.]
PKAVAAPILSSNFLQNHLFYLYPDYYAYASNNYFMEGCCEFFFSNGINNVNEQPNFGAAKNT